jgi:probable rRNA maturation factor
MGPAVDVAVAGRAALPPRMVAALVTAVVRGERRRGTVSVTFVGRDRMRALHRAWKGTSRATDVLAFAMAAPGGAVVGDVYVCPWVAAREARRRRIPVRQELARLVVHGTLHAVGWDHPDDEPARARSPMWRRQERYLVQWR